ncbi:hypothetical protein [uncultured Brevundimonas sp.]|nr:hypothetical protein [uncultured Brevundimonas sp.]
MFDRPAQFGSGFKAGWRDGRGSPAALKIGATLGIVLGLGLCVAMIVS